jgi:hypothetical protein
MRIDGEQDSPFFTSGISWGTIANAQVLFQASSTTRVDLLATGSVTTSTDAGTVTCAFRFSLDGTGFGDNLYGERVVTVPPQQWVSFVVDHHETVGAGSHTVTLQGARPDGLSECFIDALPYTKVRVLAAFR